MPACDLDYSTLYVCILRLTVILSSLENCWADQRNFTAVPKAVTSIMPQSFHQEGDGKIVILNLFQDNKLPLLVILKQVQDDEGVCSG